MSGQTIILALAAALTGAAAGWLHFTLLGHVTALLVAGRLSGVALQLGRFALLGALLWLCAQGGAVVLLACLAGILAGRAVVMRGRR